MGWSRYCYWKVLGREPDSEGRRHFAEIISGVSKQEWPLSVAQVADELLRGDEFGAHHKEGKTLLGADELNTERTGVFCRAMRHFSLKMAASHPGQTVAFLLQLSYGFPILFVRSSCGAVGKP